MADHSAEIDLDSPESTCDLARRLALRLTAGDTLLLSGGVGAGKTHFARCLIQTLLHTAEDVPSPTFTLVQTYEGKSGNIWHVDLYRISSSFEIEELGLVDAFETAVCLVEWPDRLGPLRPTDPLTLVFSPVSAPDGENQRHLHLSWQSEKWTNRLRGLLHG